MVPKHSREIREAIGKMGEVDVKEFSLDDDKTILKGVLGKFTGSENYDYPIWDNLKDWVGIDYKFSWEWFSEILADKEIVFFFEPDDDHQAFVFKNGKQLVNILNNCYRFTFYVTDQKRSFLFSYNDHDNLMACGEAKKWLSEYWIVKAENVKIVSS